MMESYPTYTRVDRPHICHRGPMLGKSKNGISHAGNVVCSIRHAGDA
jgi:hypothetical protein